MGGNYAPWPLAGDGDAIEELEAAIPADEDASIPQPHGSRDYAAGVEVAHAAEVAGAGRRRGGRRGRQRWGRRRRVIVEHQDRVGIRLLIPSIVDPGGGARVPRCDGEDGKEEEVVDATSEGEGNVVGHGV